MRGKILLFLIIFTFGFLFGATFTLTPPEATIVSGQYFPIYINFSTGGENVVACDAVINFNPNYFEAVSFDPLGSVFNNSNFDNPILFHRDNENGKVEIICGIPTPGVSGDDLYMGALILRAKTYTTSSEEFNFLFTSPGQSGESHIILDDGNGTDILTQVYGCDIDVIEGEPQITSFAQFADGIGYVSTITLINPFSDRTLTGAVLLKKSDGSEYDVDLNGVNTMGCVSFLIPPLCGKTFSTDGLGDLSSGTVQVFSNYKVEGTVLFDSPYGTAGVGSSIPYSRFFAPVVMDKSENLNSGMAFVNASDADISGVSLYLLDSSGNVISTSDLEIPAHGQAIGYIENFFPDFTGETFNGMIYYNGNMPIGGIVLRDGEESNGSFATMPVVSGGEKNLYFAQFADGDGIYSVITLVNPSDTDTANVQIFLSTEDATPLSVDLNGEVVNGVKDVSIPPRSLVRLKSDGDGTLTSGNVKAVSDIPIGGTILFSGSAGTAGVGNSVKLKGFLAPVECDLDSGVNTGIAIINLEDSLIHLTLKLKDYESGEVLSTADITISGDSTYNGEYVRFITDIFQDFFNSHRSFRGILELSPQDSNVAATVIRTGVGSYATLPVIEIK